MKLWKRMAAVLTALVLCLSLLVSASALTVEQALELLEGHYLREIPAEAYEAEDLDQLFAIIGDPYTYYMDPVEREDFDSSMEDSSVVGIGAAVQFIPEGILVMDVLEGGAKAAGVLPGDIIVEAGGVSCVPGNESLRDLLVGEAGTVVDIVVDRAGERLSFSITRSVVQILLTNSELLEGDIGYIDCDSFGSATAGHFREAIRTYGEQADAWLVDMRQNSGGSADAAVETIGVFGGPGFHLYLRDNTGKLYYYYCEDEAEPKGRVIVLTDGTSASAAEAFAAGVRDLKLGVLVGQRTYGKGVAQIVLDEQTDPEYFADGDSLKVTAYRFFSGLGITNDSVGVIPDLVVDSAHAEAVGKALCHAFEEGEEGQLMIMINGTGVVVDPAAMDSGTLAAFFEALPPQLVLQYYHADGRVDMMSVEEVVELLGVEYNSRWFKDVGDSPYAAEVNALATYKLIFGDEAGNFAPADTMTRGEACVMLGRAMNLTVSAKPMFTDVPEDHPAAPYINALCQMGWVNGVGGGKFNPDGQISRQEYITILGRMLRYMNVNADQIADSYTAEDLAPYGDLGFASWAREGAMLMGVESAENVNTPILREEAAHWMYEMLVLCGMLMQ